LDDATINALVSKWGKGNNDKAWVKVGVALVPEVDTTTPGTKITNR